MKRRLIEIREKDGMEDQMQIGQGQSETRQNKEACGYHSAGLFTMALERN